MLTPEPELKRCTKCGGEKPATAEYFHKHRNGLSPRCKTCRSADYVSNADELCAYQRDYNVRHTQERKEYAQSYRATHSRSSVWHDKNIDRYRAIIREGVKRWRIRNPEAARAAVHNRRNSNGIHSAADIRLQIKSQTDKRGRIHCWWCNAALNDSDYHVDHRIPLAKGGSNSPDNLCITCPTCNLSKGAKLPQEWIGRLL